MNVRISSGELETQHYSHTHILHHLEPPLLHQHENQVDALLVCCDLRFHVTFHIANAPAARAPWILCRILEHVLHQSIAIVCAFSDDLEGLDLCPLFKQRLGCWRHRSGKNATNISMMPSGSGEENDFILVLRKDGCDAGHIGKMTSSCSGMIGENHIAAMNPFAAVLSRELVDLIANGERHAAEVHR